MNEYRVKVSIRNNLILKAIEDQGFKNQAEFAKSIGMMTQTLSNLIAFRKAPINMSGEFCVEAMQVMEGLGACPTDLWTEEQLTLSLKRNSSEVNIGSKQLEQIQNRMSGNFIEHNTEEEANKSLVSEKVREILNELSPRRKKVLTLRFGLDGSDEHTLKEVADMLNITMQRVRQIEVEALRKMEAPFGNFRQRLIKLL
jgi:RNA polymerase sigma factor (sigma-70 family)